MSSVAPQVKVVNSGPQVILTAVGQTFSATLKVVSNPTIIVQPVGAPGPQGAPGKDGSAGGSLDWSPPSASASWLIAHNKGRIPQVSVTLPDGTQVGARVTHVDLNNTRIDFAFATSGTAHLI